MTRSDPYIQASRFLSLILRHRPEKIGLTIDADGWAEIEEITAKSHLTRQMIDVAVRDNAKQRFAVSEDGKRIRARQGHSIDVDMKFKAVKPPTVLYHGTYPRVVGDIWKYGLKKMDRQYVHMAAETSTASSVGMRRGSPILFEVQAAAMYAAGFEFYCSENGVWLTDHVPPEFLVQSIRRQDRVIGDFIYAGTHPDSVGPRRYRCRFCGDLSPLLGMDDLDEYIQGHQCPGRDR